MPFLNQFISHERKTPKEKIVNQGCTRRRGGSNKRIVRGQSLTGNKLYT
jgi:hypothetical protein